jgi:hypothetical protein
MQGDALGNHLRLQRQPGVIHTRPASGPVCCRAAKKGAGQSGGRGGIADAHFARHQKIGGRIDRVPADGQGCNHIGLGHGRLSSEIGNRPVKLQRMHFHPRPEGAGKLVDRRATCPEVCHHLHRHLCRKGGHPPRRDAMVAGEDQHQRMLDARLRPALPAGNPQCHLLQPAKRACGFCQHGIAGLRLRPRRRIRLRERLQKTAEGGKAGKGGRHDVIPD